MISKAAKPLRPPRLRMKDELLKVFLRAPVKHICSVMLLTFQHGKLGREYGSKESLLVDVGEPGPCTVSGENLSWHVAHHSRSEGSAQCSSCRL